MPQSLELQRGDCGPGEETLLALRTVLESLTETRIYLLLSAVFTVFTPFFVMPSFIFNILINKMTTEISPPCGHE